MAGLNSEKRAPGSLLEVVERISTSVRFSWGPGVESVPLDRLVDAVRTLSESAV